MSFERRVIKDALDLAKLCVEADVLIEKHESGQKAGKCDTDSLPGGRLILAGDLLANAVACKVFASRQWS